MKAKVMVSVMGVFVAAGLLSGCNMATPSQVKTGQIQIRQGLVTETLDAAQPESGRVAAIAKNYRENGNGPVRLTLSFLSGDPRYQVESETQAQKYRQDFAKNGVEDVKVDYVAVADAVYAGRVIVVYESLSASAPKDCTPITGRDGGETMDESAAYAFGCESKSALSQMIVDPRDLLGTSGVEASSARRQAAVVEGHEAGTPNQAFSNALNASSLGQ